MSAFIPKPCLPSYIWKNYFCFYPRPASPFGLQILPLSTFPCYPFSLSRVSLSLDHFHQQNVLLYFLTLNITESLDSALTLQLLTPFYRPLFRLLERIISSGYCNSSCHIHSPVYSTWASISMYNSLKLFLLKSTNYLHVAKSTVTWLFLFDLKLTVFSALFFLNTSSALQRIFLFSSYVIDGSFSASFIDSSSALSLNFGMLQALFCASSVSLHTFQMTFLSFPISVNGNITQSASSSF